MPTYFLENEKTPSVPAKAFDRKREIACFFDQDISTVFQKKYPLYQINLSESAKLNINYITGRSKIRSEATKINEDLDIKEGILE